MAIFDAGKLYFTTAWAGYSKPRPFPVIPNRSNIPHCLHEASKVQDLLRAFGIDTVLAGGACRDTVFKHKIKDYDLIVLNNSDEQDIANKLHDLYVIPWRHIPKYDECPNPEYKGVFKLSGSYDLIVWNNPPTCAEEVISRFDFNINQYWYEDDEVRFLDNAPHLTGILEEVNPESCTKERRDRFLKEYGLNM